jgi:proteasome lid subunit RPN8/RPN11
MAPSEPVPVSLPEAVLAAVFAEARAAFPAECCGWLAGPAGNDVVDAVRPCFNAQSTAAFVPGRTAETAYVIDGDDLFALSESFDGPHPAKVLYHSHPNGRAYFSETDRRVARSPWGDGPNFPVAQLVVGIDAERVVEAALFAWSPSAGDFVEVARLPGAPI